MLGMSYSAQPKRKSNVILWVVVGVIIFCVLLIGGGAIAVASCGGPVMQQSFNMVACVETMNISRESVIAYADDNEGQLPNAETWQDDIEPYYSRAYEIANSQMDTSDAPDFIPDFSVPAPGEPLTCTTPDGQTGIAFNAELSGANLNDLEAARDTVMLFEVPEPAYNLARPYEEVTDPKPEMMFGQPRDWFWIPVSGGAETGDANLSSNIDIDARDLRDGAGNEEATEGEAQEPVPAEASTGTE
jgi:hypothetical protein